MGDNQDPASKPSTRSAVLAFGVGLAFLLARRPSPPAIVIGAITPPPTVPRAATATPGAIAVHVLGAVARPGVYRLPWDSRTEEAIVAAGGTTDEADMVRTNLAQPLVDGQQVYVPARGEQVTPLLPTLPARAPLGRAQGGEIININLADAEELETLPGIGPALAKRIVEYREQHGPFTSTAELKEVSGIGDAIYNRIQDLIGVG